MPKPGAGQGLALVPRLLGGLACLGSNSSEQHELGRYTPAVFTGIVEASVPVRAWESAGAGGRLVLPSPRTTLEVPWSTSVGESVAVSGCCLTVAGYCDPDSGAQLDPSAADRATADMLFDLSAETLSRTWFDQLAAGRSVNLERSLRLGDRLGGHLVSGHVDGGGELVSIEDSGDGGALQTFQLDAGLERYLVEKGSVTLDGVSLTVVEPRGRRFGVATIPLTLELTSLGDAALGQRINVEADVVGKWVERMIGARDL